IYVTGLFGALVEYQQREKERVLANFAVTEVAQKMFDALDKAVDSTTITFIEGREGIGKTEGLKVWAAMHLGEARLVSLKGVTQKTGLFRAISKALGLASTYNRTSTEMQLRVEEVLERSKLMLIMDEAQYLLPQSERVYS